MYLLIIENKLLKKTFHKETNFDMADPISSTRKQHDVPDYDQDQGIKYIKFLILYYNIDLRNEANVYFNKKLGGKHKPDVHNLYSGHSEQSSCQEEEKYSKPLCNHVKEQKT